MGEGAARRGDPAGGREPVLLSWSGGKDSALALERLLAGGQPIAALLVTVTKEYDRVSMHGVRRTLIERQAAALGVPLEIARIPAGADNRVYQSRMEAALARHRRAGVAAVAFGDLFLEDVRRYRETRLGGVGMRAVFPIWGLDTAQLAESFVGRGFRAVVVCVDTRALSAEFAGRPYDRAFLRDLPPGVDPCGERGEFHTFVCDGPIFARAVPVALGEVVRRESWCFCDLIPGDAPERSVASC